LGEKKPKIFSGNVGNVGTRRVLLEKSGPQMCLHSKSIVTAAQEKMSSKVLRDVCDVLS
jgi:hypothetical protein